MPKTQWVDGSHLTPDQMILFFGNNAGSGHTHNAGDLDGQCPKVNLTAAAHVLGELPVANIADSAIGTFGIDVSSTYFTTPLSNQQATYIKIGKIIVIIIPSLVGTHASNAALELTPNGGTWPAAIVPSNPIVVPFPFMGYNNGTGVDYRPGALEIKSSASDNMVAWIVDASSIFGKTNFGTGGGQKGAQRGNIIYTVD